MEAGLGVLRDAFGSVPGSRFYMADERAGEPTAEYRFEAMRGKPHMTEFSVLNWRGSGGAHTDFAPVSPVRGADATTQYELVRDDAHRAGFDYLGEFIVGWRDMHHIYFLIFTATDEAERAAATEHYLRITALAAEQGYTAYRTHIAFMDEVSKLFDFNDHSLGRLHKRIKDAMDPNGILAPGKSGIWPDRYDRNA